MTDYPDLVTVITGASAGIGAALGQELSSRGAKVVLAARRLEKLTEVAARLSGPRLCVPTDVTRREQVVALRDAALAAYGRIDVWVNNAGRGITRPFEQLTDDDVDAMVRDNLKSALYGMQAVLPHFKERGAGTVANVSSMLGRVPFATFRSAYSASKAALGSLGETLRFELQKDHPGIRVMTLFPGVVFTEFGVNALGGGPDSRGLPGGQTALDVARIFADGLLQGPLDLYTRPEALGRALDHIRSAGGGA
jgi:NADP-dependent 3-hydroxy acid dehydrogenase YdfG